MKRAWVLAQIMALAAAVTLPATASADFLLLLGAEEQVEASGVDIAVPGYSVPSFDYWNGDGLPDLIVGEGSGSFPAAKVRVYLNTGTESAPQFTSFSYAQSEGADLTDAGSG